MKLLTIALWGGGGGDFTEVNRPKYKRRLAIWK